MGEWSAGTSTEHSILNACVDTIKNAENFIYIEVGTLHSAPDLTVYNIDSRSQAPPSFFNVVQESNKLVGAWG